MSHITNNKLINKTVSQIPCMASYTDILYLNKLIKIKI